MYAQAPLRSQLPPFSAGPTVIPQAIFFPLDGDFPDLKLVADLDKTDSPIAALSLPNYCPATAHPARFVRTFILLPLQDKEVMCQALVLCVFARLSD